MYQRGGTESFLGFKWKERYYVFTVFALWTGHSMLCIYEAIERASEYVAGGGIRCVMYIDDGIIMLEGRGRAERESRYIRGSLEAAGLVVNEEKSNWEPRQYGKLLGFELDTAAGRISVPQGKIENLKVILA